ncbi:MAG: gamma-glutamyltransferase [Fimbriimonas sp.]
MLALLVLAAAPPAPHVATGTRGMVASDEPLASKIGAQILRKGGNAVDAAVATAFALAVVQPTAGNLGGGGFMLVRMADGRALFLDYRERAPRAATREMYLGPNGDPIPNRSLDGLLAGGVPGTVLGMHEALQRFGKLKWRDVVQPAYELAEKGFPLSGTQARALRGQEKRLSQFSETKRIYLRDGKPYEPNEEIRLADLAATLKRVRDGGAKEFYLGETARRIDADMKARGGLITLADLKDYRVRVREPLRGVYRGHTVLSAPPPSSGGIVLLQVLNMLEGGTERPASSHTLVEAMRRAYADRSEFLGDPDFVRVPVRTLTSRSYADRLRATIDPARATPSAQVKPGSEMPKESEQTTHFSVVDAAGNCVSNTYTLNGSFGSGDTIAGTGILLNNEMDDFAAKPGTPNLYGLVQGERNAIQPGKRPLSSMTPTILLRDGKPVLVLGSPGGSTIPNTTLQVLLNFVDGNMDVAAAVGAARLHHQWLPDSLAYEDGLPAGVLSGLLAKGHLIADRPRTLGICNAISLDPRTKVRTGAADRRYADATAVAE